MAGWRWPPDHPQKPWREVAKELTEYNTLYREMNGPDARSRSRRWTFVDPSAERARDRWR